MRQIMDVSGAVLQSEREYDIASATNVVVGALVKLTDGLVVKAAAGETAAVLGITAEGHTGTEDALNPRNNGTKIIVRDAPGAIFACPAPALKALTGGNATTVKFTGATGIGASVFKGGFIKDKTGAIRRITDSSETTGTISLTVETGAVVAQDEIFVLYPPIGFNKANLNSDATGIILTATADMSIKVIGRDEVKDEIWLMASKHVLGNGQ